MMSTELESSAPAERVRPAERTIEIIGGGLAGLSLGCALRRCGVATTLIEAGDYPRHRVCGEFITGLRAQTIERLQLAPLLDDARLNSSVAWFSRGKIVRRHCLPAPAVSLSRHRLDARLAEVFRAAGGTLVTRQRNTDPADAPGRVFTTGRRREDSEWLGLKLHLLDAPLHADLELHLGDEAYVGLTRIEDQRVNLCGLFRRRALGGKNRDLLLGYLHATGLGELARRIESSDIDAESFCAVAAMQFDARLKRHPQLRLGDAGAAIPPFTGHGMAMAFQSAEIALDPLVEFARGQITWAEARERIQSALRRRFRVRLLSAYGLHSWLLRPGRQRWLAWLNRAHLLPLRPLYSALH